MKKVILSFFILFLFFSCEIEKETPDLILKNGNIYTVDTQLPDAQSVAIKDGIIIKAGTNEEIEGLADENTQKIDLKGQFLMPGFIEGHGHFSGLGKSLLQLNFLRSKSWEEIVAMVAKAAENAAPGEWIEGRGWHQEKWDSSPIRNVHGYPFHDALSTVSPNNPVVLRHASGHGIIANKKAMEMANITNETPNPVGGEIVRDIRGNAIGVFEERAMKSILDIYKAHLSNLSKEDLKNIWLKGVELAQKECLKKGITSFQDAGTTPGGDFLSSYEELAEYERLAKEGKLDLRMWTMLRHGSEDLKNYLNEFPKIDIGNGFFTCRAVKSELDGALGSYGAWLLEPYDDKPGFVGQNTTSVEEVNKIASLCLQHKMQLCVHAIGDRGNREVLDIIEQLSKKSPEIKELRWRMEHAQHLHIDDIPRFEKLGVVAAMQGVHCTSDAPFVVKRLGEERAKEGAYAWKSLLKSGAVVANGTDAPVEDVSAIESYYASVTRKRADSGMEFFTEQAMTRAEGIYSYTMANAYAGFQEEKKGSITPGKYADMVLLSNDLINCSDDEILKTEVLMTIVGGKIKYQSENFNM